MNWPLELEVGHKLAQMRGWLEQERAGAVRLRGVDWFAWATAGASNSHCHTTECGCAEVLVTRDAAYILTDEAEAMRMREEEVRGPWTWQVSPWMQPQLYELREHFVQHAAGGAPVLSDRPGLHERSLPVALREERLVLLESEQQRYRQVGQLAAGAAADALRQANVETGRRQLALAAVLRGEVEDIGATGAEVGAEQPDGAVAVAADDALPLHADLGSLLGADLGDEAFDVDLRAAHVQQVDDAAQLAVQRLRRGDDEGVVGGVGLHLAASGGCGGRPRGAAGPAGR